MTTPIPQRRATGWADERFAAVAETVRIVSGLVFPPNRQPSAETAMRRVMTANHVTSPEALLRGVAVPGELRDSLIAELTIGESYFFRDWATLALLETEILPARAQDAESGGLRIWSAGCSTGEEPYSVAIRLREIANTLDVTILGTDIAQPRLDAAGRARYTKWALRGVAPERVERWFSRKGTHYQLDESIRHAVRFAHLNLAAEEYPSSATGTGDQDLILCRNVLIYFEIETIRGIAERFLQSLKPEGWLMLGASDPPLAGLVECQVISTTGGVVYRRATAKRRMMSTANAISPNYAAIYGETAASPSVFVAPATPFPQQHNVAKVQRAVTVEAPTVTSKVYVHSIDPDVATLTAEVAYQRGDYALAEELAANEIRTAPERAQPWITSIRALANLGRVDAATERVRRAIETHRLNAELHYLDAMLQLQVGNSGSSITSARRALYLDRTFVMGYMLLGDALARQSDHAGARRAFGNALRQLDTSADDASIAASDGVPVSRLRQIAREHMRLLPGVT